MSRGHDRERQVKALLEADDWFVVRAAGSLGDADLVALRAKTYELEPGVLAYTHRGIEARIIEVKSTAGGPYERFGPQQRAALLLAAEISGAEPWLVWWPPRGKPHWISSHTWPPVNDATEEAAV